MASGSRLARLIPARGVQFFDAMRSLSAVFALTLAVSGGDALADESFSAPPLVEADGPLFISGAVFSEEPTATSWNRGARLSLMALAGMGGTVAGTGAGTALGAGVGAAIGGCRLSLLGGPNELGCIIGGVAGAVGGLFFGTALAVDLVGMAGGGGSGLGRALGGSFLGGALAIAVLAALSGQVSTEAGLVLSAMPALFSAGMYELGADDGSPSKDPIARVAPVFSARGAGGSVGLVAMF